MTRLLIEATSESNKFRSETYSRENSALAGKTCPSVQKVLAAGIVGLYPKPYYLPANSGFLFVERRSKHSFGKGSFYCPNLLSPKRTKNLC
jgi:hypothetical protein